jgi:hypothetical protein
MIVSKVKKSACEGKVGKISLFINCKNYFFYRCQYKVNCYHNCSADFLIITTPQLTCCREKKKEKGKGRKEEGSTAFPQEKKSAEGLIAPQKGIIWELLIEMML